MTIKMNENTKSKGHNLTRPNGTQQNVGADRDPPNQSNKIVETQQSRTPKEAAHEYRGVPVGTLHWQ